MADSKKYIGIYDTLEDVQDALDNGQLSKPYVAKTMDNGQLDYNSLSPVDYSQYWCTYYPIDAKIWVTTALGWNATTIEYTGGDGKIPKADFPNFYGAGSKRNFSNENSTVTKFKYFQFDSLSSVNNFEQAWTNCSSLTSFPQLDLSSGTNFKSTWKNCSSLTEFPMLDLSNGTDFYGAWQDCSGLTKFPSLDLSSGTNFIYTWYGCNALTSFPALDLSAGTQFQNAWNGCSSLTEFPPLDLSSGTDFTNAWSYCSNLTNLGGFGAISADIDLSGSPKLTVESLMNVINQAADLAALGITGRTMTLGSDNLAKLSDEQKAVATSKRWTLA